jgi:hypothetical protein
MGVDGMKGYCAAPGVRMAIYGMGNGREWRERPEPFEEAWKEIKSLDFMPPLHEQIVALTADLHGVSSRLLVNVGVQTTFSSVRFVQRWP